MADGSPEHRAVRTQMNDLTFSAPDSSHGDIKKYSGQTLDGGTVKLSFYKEQESSVSCEKSALSGVAADDTAGLAATDSRKLAGSIAGDGDDRKKRCFDRYDSSESSDRNNMYVVNICASCFSVNRFSTVGTKRGAFRQTRVCFYKNYQRSVNCAMHLLPRRPATACSPRPRHSTPRTALPPVRALFAYMYAA
ncbi:hypothetical protein RR46_14609 [Papilio xuthus]|uniref:Uncharacterized protein n=1 Tax=Papilio xuthus TaxID=66420 RepID=A0A194PJ44_PAPXU|nr:hypothetical protein RR46_14609 [Papilio xuthus]